MLQHWPLTNVSWGPLSRWYAQHRSLLASKDFDFNFKRTFNNLSALTPSPDRALVSYRLAGLFASAQLPFQSLASRWSGHRRERGAKGSGWFRVLLIL